MKTKTLALLVAASCSFPLLIPSAFAQGTAFTYQGRLNDGAGPANGTYDLGFTIFAAGSGGSAVAGPLTNAATGVTNGLFSVTLDFGAGVFTGADRWLEMAVRTNGGTNFSTLTPRQLVTAAPNAIRANSAGSAGTAAFATNAGSVAAANITGTIGVLQLAPAVVINGESGVTLSGTFSGSGFGLSDLVANQIAFGTLADARLTANVALRAGGNTFLGNQTINGNASVNGLLNLNSPGFPGVTAFLRSKAGDSLPLAVQGTDGALLLLVFTNGLMEVAGDVNAGGIFTGDGSGLSNLNASSLSTGTVDNERLSDDVVLKGKPNTFTGDQNFTSGHVGIGTTLPSQLLQVGSTNIPNTQGMIALASRSGSGVTTRLWEIGVPETDEVTNGTGYSFVINDTGNGAAPEMMVQFGSGNVGIGTTNPVTKLEVNGEITALAFNTTSDREAKEEFQPVDSRAVLEKVAHLPISEWQFKEQADTRHLGPMAQDFHEAFGLGRDDRHITSVDADGVALAAIQGLNEKLEARTRKLEAENAEMKQRLEKLERLMGEKRGGAE